MAATTAMVMATAKTKTGKDDNVDSQGQRQQQARMATTTGENDDTGKEGNSKDDGNNGKDDRRGW